MPAVSSAVQAATAMAFSRRRLVLHPSTTAAPRLPGRRGQPPPTRGIAVFQNKSRAESVILAGPFNSKDKETESQSQRFLKSCGWAAWLAVPSPASEAAKELNIREVENLSPRSVRWPGAAGDSVSLGYFLRALKPVFKKTSGRV